MIRNSTTSAVLTSAETLAAHGLSLTPVAGSPLEELSHLCKPLAVSEGARTMPPDVDEPVPQNYDITKASQYTDRFGVCPHDETMQEYVCAAARIVENNLNLARNVVNPMVKEVVEQAMQYADAKGRSTTSPMNVVPYYLPAPYNNPILAEIVSRYGETVNTDMKLTIVFPQMAANVIREKAQTGITRLDEDIVSWLNNCSDGAVEGVYNAVFGDGAKTLTEALSDPTTRATSALLIFLLARRFMDDIPEGINAPLNVYKEYVSGIMSQAGRQVVYVIQNRANNDRTNALVVRAPYKYDTQDFAMGDVIVNPDVYRRWLKEGGTPEAIFGAIHSGKSTLVYADLIDNKDTYVKAWQRASNLLKTRAGFERFNLFLEGMRQALLNQLQSLPEDIRTGTDALYKQRIGETLQRVKEGGVDEPWAMGRKLVCRVFFPETDAENVLWAIATQCKEHPDIDVREAALLATIEIVTKWVAAQFDVEKVQVSASSRMAA